MSSLMWPGSPGGKMDGWPSFKSTQSQATGGIRALFPTCHGSSPPKHCTLRPTSVRPWNACAIDLHLPSHFNLNGSRPTMTPSRRFQYTPALLLALLSSTQPLVAAQDCYYPNGDLSTTDAPCSSAEGAACCPLNWQCLDNGLCYLDNQKYFGRYTCTDKSWQSSACPGYCTNRK